MQAASAAVLQLLLTLSWAAAPGEWVLLQPASSSYLAAYANSSFRTPSPDLDFLRNVSVVFFGDSLTRYQFMYLAQYLHRGRWEDIPGHRLCCERHYGTFGRMYHAYLPVMGCSHVCDCADHVWFDPATITVRKGRVRPKGREYPRKVRNENHYFRHGPLQARLTFHFWGGEELGLTSHVGTPSAADFVQYCADFPETATAHLHPPPAPRHLFPSVQAFIRDVLRGEGHDMLVFNYGLWRVAVRNATPPTLAEANLDRLAEVARAAAPTVVWKTTTANQRWNPIDDAALLEGLSRRGFEVWDAYNLTLGVLHFKEAMWDGFHFEPFVYRELNIAFLEFLRAALRRRQPGHTAAAAASAPSASHGEDASDTAANK
eukprot:EG_transcript_11112